MAYVRKKKVGEREYYQLVEGYRENGKVRQRVLSHLGRQETPEAALTFWQERAEWERRRARDCQHAAEYIRQGRAGSPYYGAQRRKRLVPRADTPLDSPSPAVGGFAPRGWFYSGGTAEEVEQEAQEYLARADKWDERVARLRAAL
jgi:hypothetical protein